MDFSCLFTVVVLPSCFLLGRSAPVNPSIVYALLLARSASVHRLFLFFSSINSFSSRQFRSSPSIVSAVLVARSASVSHLFMLFFASLLASFALVRRLLLLFSLMDLGGVR